MPTKVEIIKRVSDEDRAIMAACDRLKLAAIGYGSVVHGADTSPEMLQMALGALYQAAIHYFGALANVPIRLSSLGARLGEESLQRSALKIAAQAYASATRVSKTAGTTHQGLVSLCHAAIRYVEHLVGAEPGRVKDRTLRLR